MKEELDNWLNQINVAKGAERKKVFINFCMRLIELKEEGNLSAEAAAYEIMNALKFDDLSDCPECEAIFDVAGTTEIPRELSYAQPIDNWNAEMAQKIKEGEWEELVSAIYSARDALFSKVGR